MRQHYFREMSKTRQRPGASPTSPRGSFRNISPCWKQVWWPHEDCCFIPLCASVLINSDLCSKMYIFVQIKCWHNNLFKGNRLYFWKKKKNKNWISSSIFPRPVFVLRWPENIETLAFKAGKMSRLCLESILGSSSLTQTLYIRKFICIMFEDIKS